MIEVSQIWRIITESTKNPRFVKPGIVAVDYPSFPIRFLPPEEPVRVTPPPYDGSTTPTEVSPTTPHTSRIVRRVEVISTPDSPTMVVEEIQQEKRAREGTVLEGSRKKPRVAFA
jgi:hypothetical protein